MMDILLVTDIKDIRGTLNQTLNGMDEVHI
jgi:hypothetical protein